ncbi:MAG: hypothetical protein Q8N88_07030, partial [Nanoarchaeota archaeon]|nr:hypothetical protein [Nanoarchaeota archaeon]
MNLKIIFLLLFLLLPLALAIPENLNINGKLTDADSNALEGNYNLTFKIYNLPSGGTAFWSSTNQSVTTDSDGVFTAILSDVNLN